MNMSDNMVELLEEIDKNASLPDYIWMREDVYRFFKHKNKKKSKRFITEIKRLNDGKLK
jgi:hypothetical protein